MDDRLIFIKLGGSLITDKDKENHANKEIIKELLKALFLCWEANPDLKVLLGHGSGSFGHAAAAKYHTRDGVRNLEDWLGYQKVWQAARALHNIVLDLGLQLELPLISFPPSAMISARNGQVSMWNLEPIAVALENRLIPVVYGDVVVDEDLVGTILSTEDLFVEMAANFQPDDVFLVGKEAGVFEDFPNCKTLIPHLDSHSPIMSAILGSESTDVTGGMREKVLLMQKLCAMSPITKVHIFSGLQPENLSKVLNGDEQGTLITTL